MKQVQQTFTGDIIWEPLYQIETPVVPFEIELFQSATLRRLKHLHHFGAGALISPITHSRFEHTVGVWSLTKFFFPEWRELHAAAILHDIGHLPFSHSVEKSLGKNHHLLTEANISSFPVRNILEKHSLNPSQIIDLLNQNTPLSSKSDGISIDHFDSFMRDTYGAGEYIIHPAILIKKINFYNNVIDTDENTAIHILDAVIKDNRIFLNPHFLAMDELLSRAIILFSEENPEIYKTIDQMTDYQLLSMLEGSVSGIVKELINVLVNEPHRVTICKNSDQGEFKAEVRKVYNKQPFVNGIPIDKVLPEVRQKILELDALCQTYRFDIKN
ncbi:HD domain-containing protein [Paenibacillus radicis (ex Xue et al. 2023)]|uniref:HD domain-containing protein n=1 Tax=Paenibacillus radicis (ex Xue et al. 2023) TaxID=2972489 RepID=A0ABT1YBH4_9BACL|nr:HD domain-containing protein [Paenibacillus radicis (ex Xue et al. 2023)]MCR8630110.1 HD domain-containing protein [Paenibacillus radicis (ex Xue et al. 2023)]